MAFFKPRARWARRVSRPGLVRAPGGRQRDGGSTPFRSFAILAGVAGARFLTQPLPLFPLSAPSVPPMPATHAAPALDHPEITADRDSEASRAFDTDPVDALFRAVVDADHPAFAAILEGLQPALLPDPPDGGAFARALAETFNLGSAPSQDKLDAGARQLLLAMAEQISIACRLGEPAAAPEFLASLSRAYCVQARSDRQRARERLAAPRGSDLAPFGDQRLPEPALVDLVVHFPDHLAVPALPLFVENGADSREPDNDGQTPLIVAASLGKIDLVVALAPFGAGAPASAQGRDAFWAVVEALRGRLLSSNADGVSRRGPGDAQWAAALRALLPSADLSRHDAEGRSALHSLFFAYRKIEDRALGSALFAETLERATHAAIFETRLSGRAARSAGAVTVWELAQLAESAGGSADAAPALAIRQWLAARERAALGGALDHSAAPAAKPGSAPAPRRV
jgi:hypothetical protein